MPNSSDNAIAMSKTASREQQRCSLVGLVTVTLRKKCSYEYYLYIKMVLLNVLSEKKVVIIFDIDQKGYSDCVCWL